MTAKRLLESMIKVNLIPDIVTFNIIIKALCDMNLVGDATILVWIPCCNPIRNLVSSPSRRFFEVGAMLET